MRIIYNIGIHIYDFLIFIYSFFNEKASLLYKGRKGWYEKLKQCVVPDEKYFWTHCASLGEFEQGRPVIESFKKRHPDYKIIVTFFSPSGYEIRKNYKEADIVCYLPSDTPRNAKLFVDVVKPSVAVIVKYEIWCNILNAVADSGTPLYLISGIFRPQQRFFKWYGDVFRKTLRKFDTFFVQDEQSKQLLKSIGIEKVLVTGDTRFDRVMQIADAAKDIPQILSFKGDEKLFLCGSSWHGDETIIKQYINKNPNKMKWIFAPHEIDKANVDRLASLFTTSVARFSTFTEDDIEKRVLIIDNIGMLSSAYRYADIAAVGGGFGKGIHNILEAACWNIPVLFGPNHEKFKEAVDMLRIGGAKCYSNYDDFEAAMDSWLSDEALWQKAANEAGKYVKNSSGATQKIIDVIEKNLNV